MRLAEDFFGLAAVVVALEEDDFDVDGCGGRQVGEHAVFDGAWSAQLTDERLAVLELDADLGVLQARLELRAVLELYEEVDSLAQTQQLVHILDHRGFEVGDSREDLDLREVLRVHFLLRYLVRGAYAARQVRVLSDWARSSGSS